MPGMRKTMTAPAREHWPITRSPVSATTDGLDTSHLQRDLGRRSLRGGTIAFASQLVRFAAQFAATALLARLLTPEAFGLVAMAGSIAIILDMVKEFGLSEIGRAHV